MPRPTASSRGFARVAGAARRARRLASPSARRHSPVPAAGRPVSLPSRICSRNSRAQRCRRAEWAARANSPLEGSTRRCPSASSVSRARAPGSAGGSAWGAIRNGRAARSRGGVVDLVKLELVRARVVAAAERIEMRFRRLSQLVQGCAPVARHVEICRDGLTARIEDRGEVREPRDRVDEPEVLDGDAPTRHQRVAGAPELHSPARPMGSVCSQARSPWQLAPPMGALKWPAICGLLESTGMIWTLSQLEPTPVV